MDSAAQVERHILVDEELAKESSDAEVQVVNSTSKRTYAAVMFAVGLVCLCGVALKRGGASQSVGNMKDVLEEYDCNAGLSNWDMGWSDGKKRFCCRFKACHGFVNNLEGGYDHYHHDGDTYHYHHYEAQHDASGSSGGHGSYHEDRYHPLHYEGRWYSQAELKEIYDKKHKYHHDSYSDRYTQEELKRMYEEQSMGHHVHVHVHHFHYYHDADEYETVVIGNTLQENTNHKCVDAPDHVRCDNHAEQMGRTGKFPDKFRISHIGNKVCAYRIDSKGAWGLNLVLKCKKDYSGQYATDNYAPHGYKEIHIGNTLSTHESHKCVSDPGDVHCDDKSEQVGRTGAWKDQFDIYHSHDLICARRTDDAGEWGLNLILKCKKTTW